SFAISKEVLCEAVSEVCADYFHQADKLGVLNEPEHPLNKKFREIRLMKERIAKCTGEEELKALDEKLLQYALDLKKMNMGSL
ncbi:hypothetical protein, partial [Treponema sp. R6D11]